MRRERDIMKGWFSRERERKGGRGGERKRETVNPVKLMNARWVPITELPARAVYRGQYVGQSCHVWLIL